MVATYVSCTYFHAGVPQILSLQGAATNTSVTLQWELPDNIQISDTYFNVRSTFWPLLL